MSALLKDIESGGTAQRPTRRMLGGSTSTEARRSYERDLFFDSWGEALLGNALLPATPGIRQVSLFSKTPSRLWSQTMAASVDRLGRMKDGWADADSKAPSHAALRELQELAPFLPLMTRTPDIEIDPGDGEIKLAWRSTLTPRSIAIAFCGDGVARVMQSNLEKEAQVPFFEVPLDASAKVNFATTLSEFENSDLLEAE